MSTWLITGCSTGLGRALAETVIASGHDAVVTTRDVDKVADLAADNTDRVLALSLDVTDTAQVTNVVRPAEEKFGGISVLVNNAGYGYRASTTMPTLPVRNATRRMAPSQATGQGSQGHHRRGRVRRSARVPAAGQRCAQHLSPARRSQTRHHHDVGAPHHKH